MSGLDFSQSVSDSRFNGYVSVLWIVLRGNLDHEVHHRGQLASYLRVLQDLREKNYKIEIT